MRYSKGSSVLCGNHRRETVELTDELRKRTMDMAREMNDYLQRSYTPKVKTGNHCNACSLKELCLPAICRRLSVSEYIRAHLEEEGDEE